MVLCPLVGHWVLVAHNKVDLVGGAALVWAKHDNVGRLVVQLAQVWDRVVGHDLQVGASTLEALLQAHLVLQHKRVAVVHDQGL